MTITTELNQENTITAEELAEAYDSYTNADELYNAINDEAYAQAEPTTTVLTTSLDCGKSEY